MNFLAVSLICFMLAARGPSGRTLEWKPVPLHFNVAGTELRIVLTDPLPKHWAIGVVPVDAEGVGRISVASVQFDGVLVDRIENLGKQHIDVHPGLVRVKNLGDLAGVAICVSIPKRTEAIVTREGLLVARSPTGLLIQDGTVATRNPRACGALLALQQAVLHEGLSPVQ